MDLALELAGPTCSVALRTPDDVVHERDFSDVRGRGLMAAVDELCRAHDARGKLSRVVVGVGPGSYTGLRIACSAARMLAWAEGIEAVGVGSLGAAAEAELRDEGSPAHGGELHLLVDAFRGEFYHAAYRLDGEVLVETAAPRIVTREEAPSLLADGTPYLGDAAVAPAARHRGEFAPRAAALLRIARSTPDMLREAEPLYLRETAYKKRG